MRNRKRTFVHDADMNVRKQSVKLLFWQEKRQSVRLCLKDIWKI